MLWINVVGEKVEEASSLQLRYAMTDGSRPSLYYIAAVGLPEHQPVSARPALADYVNAFSAFLPHSSDSGFPLSTDGLIQLYNGTERNHDTAKSGDQTIWYEARTTNRYYAICLASEVPLFCPTCPTSRTRQPRDRSASGGRPASLPRWRRGGPRGSQARGSRIPETGT